MLRFRAARAASNLMGPPHAQPTRNGVGIGSYRSADKAIPLGLLINEIERQHSDADLREALEQAMLTREMSHRVKNSLARGPGNSRRRR